MNVLDKYVASCLIYNAVEMKLVQVEDVLNYLLSVQVTQNTLIAYRHLLLLIPGDRHYCKGSHFLTRAAPEYGAIYAMSNAPEKIRPLSDGDEVEAGMFYYKGVLLMQQQLHLANCIRIITDQSNYQLQPGDINLAVKARSNKLLSILTNYLSQSITMTEVEKIERYYLSQNILDTMIEVDWIEKMEQFYIPEKLFIILNNFQQRSNLLPLYWEKIAPRCQEFLREIFAVGKILPNLNLPIKIKLLFPNFFPTITNTFSDKAWFIYQLPTYLQGYILGYPIHEKNPTHEELNLALQNLSNIGVEAYAKNYEEKHKDIIMGSSGERFGFTSVKTTIVNENNTLEESVFSYSTYDVVSFDDGNKRYLFTRPEFKTITEKGRNLWTNLDLPFQDIILISSKEAVAQLLLLPSSIPLKDLLTNIETYIPKLTDESRVYLKDPNTASEEVAREVELQVISPSQLIQFLSQIGLHQ